MNEQKIFEMLLHLSNDMKSMQENMKSMQENMKSMQENMKSMQEDITELKADMNTRFDAVDKRLTAITNMVVKNSEDIEELKNMKYKLRQTNDDVFILKRAFVSEHAKEV
ncbi:hypothetical protein G4V62_16355 [Bacillaceae bacterium SIJ1]|uniref:hypothetical protein n=1 Tax=Litoribacterium kuwaitense TaxID=1398745 RepID=UPI0013EAFCAA|nr:hypothetical protein [Litoribacterium kuwaitense]NGP46442.1 hypothetical protein [Litoribacterium kuwaitense]